MEVVCCVSWVSARYTEVAYNGLHDEDSSGGDLCFSGCREKKIIWFGLVVLTHREFQQKIMPKFD